MFIKHKRKITYRSTDALGRPVPCLPLQGAFLRDYNFNVGGTVEVKYSPGFVHISTIINNRYGDDLAAAVAR